MTNFLIINIILIVDVMIYSVNNYIDFDMNKRLFQNGNYISYTKEIILVKRLAKQITSIKNNSIFIVTKFLIKFNIKSYPYS